MKIAGMCMNWKIVAGLAVVGLGIWAVAPNLIGAVAPLFLLAACPLSMLFMMRGMGGRGGGSSRATPPAQTTQPTQIMGTRDEQLADLKARHEAIAHEIARIEAEMKQSRASGLVVGTPRGVSPN